MVVGLVAHFYMIEEDDVALEVVWIFYVIVYLRFLSIAGFIVICVGQFVCVVDPVVARSKISSELFIFLC